MINFKVITLFNRVTESCLVPIKIVGLPRFELGLTEPKSVVLPLHHSPIKYYSHEPYFPTTGSQFVINVAEKEGFEPCNMTNTLAGCRFRPLSHFSNRVTLGIRTLYCSLTNYRVTSYTRRTIKASYLHRPEA